MVELTVQGAPKLQEMRTGPLCRAVRADDGERCDLPAGIETQDAGI